MKSNILNRILLLFIFSILTSNVEAARTKFIIISGEPIYDVEITIDNNSPFNCNIKDKKIEVTDSKKQYYKKYYKYQFVIKEKADRIQIIYSSIEAPIILTRNSWGNKNKVTIEIYPERMEIGYYEVEYVNGQPKKSYTPGSPREIESMLAERKAEKKAKRREAWKRFGNALGETIENKVVEYGRNSSNKSSEATSKNTNYSNTNYQDYKNVVVTTKSGRSYKLEAPIKFYYRIPPSDNKRYDYIKLRHNESSSTVRLSDIKHLSINRIENLDYNSKVFCSIILKNGASISGSFIMSKVGGKNVRNGLWQDYYFRDLSSVSFP